MNTSKGWKAGPRKPQHSEYETAAPGTTLPPEQAAAIRDWMMGRPFDQARRGLVVLLAGERVPIDTIERCTGYGPQEIEHWQRSFQKLGGIKGLELEAEDSPPKVSESRAPDDRQDVVDDSILQERRTELATQLTGQDTADSDEESAEPVSVGATGDSSPVGEYATSSEETGAAAVPIHDVSPIPDEQQVSAETQVASHEPDLSVAGASEEPPLLQSTLDEDTVIAETAEPLPGKEQELSVDGAEVPADEAAMVAPGQEITDPDASDAPNAPIEGATMLADQDNPPPVEEAVMPDVAPGSTPGRGALTSPGEASEPAESDQSRIDLSLSSGEQAPADEAQPAPGEHGLWQVNPPVDKNDPVPDELSEALVGLGRWQIVAASRRGRLHAHEGLYREDAFAVAVEGPYHVLVVADGAGSALLSRVGANLAVKAVLDGVRKKLQELPDEPNESTRLREILAEGLSTAWQELHNEADRRKLDVRDLATTLLVILHSVGESGHRVATAQIGDGLLAAFRRDGTILVLETPDQGHFSGETYFLTSIPSAGQVVGRVHVHEQPLDGIEMLLAMTDGVADDFWPAETELRRLIKPLAGILSSQPGNEGEAAARLLELLGYSRRGSFDDRTLVVCASPDAKAVIEEVYGGS